MLGGAKLAKLRERERERERERQTERVKEKKRFFCLPTTAA